MNLVSDYIEIDDEQEENFQLWDKMREKNTPKHFKLSLIFLSLTGLVAYAIFAFLCKTKEECDIYTPYVTIIPVIQFFKEYFGKK